MSSENSDDLKVEEVFDENLEVEEVLGENPDQEESRSFGGGDEIKLDAGDEKASFLEKISNFIKSVIDQIFGEDEKANEDEKSPKNFSSDLHSSSDREDDKVEMRSSLESSANYTPSNSIESLFEPVTTSAINEIEGNKLTDARQNDMDFSKKAEQVTADIESVKDSQDMSKEQGVNEQESRIKGAIDQVRGILGSEHIDISDVSGKASHASLPLARQKGHEGVEK